MPKKIYGYVVAGDGPFPLDMLRHDRSWPSDQTSVHHMEPAAVIAREVRLETLERGPDAGRWASMGWKVVEQRSY